MNDVLKHGYGTASDLNKVYVDMLRSMNIDAMLAYVVDRDEGLFIPKVKYWQFNRSLVFVELGGEKHGFYNPAQKFLPFGALPWYNDGVLAFIVGSMHHLFVVTTSSTANQNRLITYFNWEMDSTLKIKGTAKISYRGHSARRLRFRLDDVTQNEKNHFLKKEALKKLPFCTADSFQIENPDDADKPVILRFKLHVPSIGYRDGRFVFLNPLSVIRSGHPEFYDETREFSIALNYPQKQIDIISLAFPPTFSLVSLPQNQVFQNEIGSLTTTYRRMNGRLMIQRLFVLKKAFIRSKNYSKLKELLNHAAHSTQAPLILQARRL